jgi:hypothetical protein
MHKLIFINVMFCARLVLVDTAVKILMLCFNGGKSSLFESKSILLVDSHGINGNMTIPFLSAACMALSESFIA